jgi:hypothetical protein
LTWIHHRRRLDDAAVQAEFAREETASAATCAAAASARFCDTGRRAVSLLDREHRPKKSTLARRAKMGSTVFAL